jgi:hypothetical protein
MTRRTVLPILLLALLFAACPPPHPPAPVMVKVTVCAESLLLPNPFCPSTEVREFRPDAVPTAVCTLHVAPPEPPAIPVCASPWPESGKLRIWSGTLLGGLSTRDNATFKESDLPAYYDAIAEDGPNCERNFAYFEDDGAWTSYRPSDPDYYQHLIYRINLAVQRKITEILCLTPYGITNSDDEIRTIIRATKQFLPYIIYEAVNEPRDNERQKEIVAILQAEGIPNKNIQIEYVDSGAFFDLLATTLKGEGLATLHWVGTMDTVDADWPMGWSTSDGTMKLMGYGMYGSNDGQDAARAAKGLNWWAHSQMTPPVTEYRRPDNPQLAEVTPWMLANGRGYEHLSAAGFQASATPDLRAAIELGRAERRAMRR